MQRIAAPMVGGMVTSTVLTLPQEDVWPGDTLGLVEEPGQWLATGTLAEGESQEIHPDDPAQVRLSGDQPRSIRGSVEWVHHAGNRSSTAEVAVDFQHPGPAEAVGPSAEVIVTPSGPSDSVLAAPKSAIVSLSAGLALFIPQGSGKYEVRFAYTGPRTENLVVLRDGVQERTAIVLTGHGALVRAARVSLARRERDRR